MRKFFALIPLLLLVTLAMAQTQHGRITQQVGVGASFIDELDTGILNNIRVVGSKFTTLQAAIDDCVVTNTTHCIVFSNTPETFAVNPWVNVIGTNLSIHVFLGPGTWLSDVTVIQPQKNTVTGSGRGDIGGPGTSLRPSASFSTSFVNGDAVSRNVFWALGDRSEGTASHGTRISNLTLNCQDFSDVVCLYSETINELSGPENLLITNFDAYGVLIENTAGGTPQNYFVSALELINATDTSTIGISLECSAADGPRIDDISFNGGTAVAAKGLEIVDCPGGLATGLHFEDATDGLSISGTGFAFIGVSGAATCTDLVQIESGAQNIFLAALKKGTCTNVLNDVVKGNTLVSTTVALYVLGDGATESLFSLNNSVSNNRFNQEIDFAGGINVGSGIRTNGSGFKHARTTTGSIALSSSAAVTVTWTTAFADANYTLCGVEVVEADTDVLTLHIDHVELVSASAVDVRVENRDAGAAKTGTLHVCAVHD